MMSKGKIVFLTVLILSVSSSSFAGTVIFKYDSLNRLTEEQRPDDGITFRYAYDQAGNRLTAEIIEIADSDKDGLPDSVEDVTCTDTNDADTDNDGVSDGNEDLNNNGKQDPGETDPCDADTDDDGISDGNEDLNNNGEQDPGETDPRDADTDDDGIQDGTELGRTAPDTSDTNTDIFIPDEDPATTTDPLNDDSDSDLLTDGQEDTDFNGKYEPEDGETDPNKFDFDAWTVLYIRGEEQVTGSTFTESSLSGHIVTVAGSEKQDIAEIGNYSWKFSGSDNYLETPDSDDFTFGAEDFTVDFWMKSGSNGNIIGHGAWNNSGNRGWTFYNTGGRRNKVCALFSKDGTGTGNISLYSSLAPDNNWHHIAVTRNGSIFKMFADGLEKASVIYDGALYDSSEALKVGSSDNWNAIDGYLDEIRIIKGRAMTRAEIEDYIQGILVVRGPEKSEDTALFGGYAGEISIIRGDDLRNRDLFRMIIR